MNLMKKLLTENRVFFEGAIYMAASRISSDIFFEESILLTADYANLYLRFLFRFFVRKFLLKMIGL